jgi:putative component of toxin-antitoxin plasmid stabilization module
MYALAYMVIIEKMIENRSIILILGGNKNGQEKDIKQSQKIAEKIHQS